MVLGQQEIRHDRDVHHRGADDGDVPIRRDVDDRDVLIRQIDTRLAALRAATRTDSALAERVAEVLRRLVVDTARASAADRARVRAAVRYFVVRRAADVRVVNEILRDLGRVDLALPDRWFAAGPAERGGRGIEAEAHEERTHAGGCAPGR
jgi:hypothetical protein